MRAKRLDSRAGRDGGFTLIELLVVIIIIGILSAIAIPVFLGQRRNAHDAAAKSDLRRIAQLEEAHLYDKDFYGTLAQLRQVEDVRVSPGVTLEVVRFDSAKGYCLRAQHRDSTVPWYYDSSARGLQDRGTRDCPVTNAASGATPGDSITG